MTRRVSPNKPLQPTSGAGAPDDSWILAVARG